MLACGRSRRIRKGTREHFSTDMNYQEAIEYLYSVRLFGTKLGLANTQQLLRELGNPEKKLLTVHVAGTNGKGSVCALVSSILSAAGYKAGMFTSPHILSFRERMRVGEAMISEGAVCAHLKRLLPIIGEMSEKPGQGHPTFFEIVTALTVDYFAESSVDVAIVETGMGGRLDATNVLPSEIEVITAIGLEHTAYLGGSIEEIASEKAGIIKEGATVIVGERGERARGVILGKAAEKRAKLLQLGEDIRFANRQVRFPVQQLDVVSEERTYPGIVLPLLGEHQAANCCLAIAVAEELQRREFSIESANIYEGIRKTRWPGRFEVIRGRPNYILDAACNPHACEALAKTIREVVGKAELTMIAGFFRDKDYRRMCEILLPMADNIILTEPQSERALPVKELRAVAVSVVPGKEIHYFEAIDGAIAYASGLSSSVNSFVCIAGSNYLLGPARKALELDDLPKDFVVSESFEGDKTRPPGEP